MDRDYLMNNQMANDIKYVGNTQFMMPNDKKPRPIYNKNNKFTIAFKKLYREGTITDNPNLIPCISRVQIDS